MKLAPLKITELLNRYDIRPSRGLGQNFLVDEAALQRVVAAAEIDSADSVLEVGPGLGSLTRYLAVVARRVVAVELDRKMLAPLRAVLEPHPNVEVVSGDILEFDLGAHFTEPGYLVVANIPYYITSALIRHLLEAPQPPARLVLTVQKEVAQRMSAQPGKMSLLSLSVQVYGAPKVVGSIPAGAFYPPPNVDSSIVRVDLFPEPLIAADKLETFFRLAKAGFSMKRKMLSNTLSAGMAWSKEQAVATLEAAEIDPQRRAQTLSIEEWGKLVELV